MFLHAKAASALDSSHDLGYLHVPTLRFPEPSAHSIDVRHGHLLGVRLTMRITPPPLEIGDDEGFQRGKDLFNRQPAGEGLMQLLSSLEEPIVMALDGDWGTGKTTFLKMWAGHLRSCGFPVAYYDAFEHDYMSDPFLAIAAEIIALAQKERKRGIEKVEKLKQSTKAVSRLILRSAFRAGSKIVLGEALESADPARIHEIIEKEAFHLSDQLIDEALANFESEKKTLQSFREALSDLPTLLVNESDASDEEGNGGANSKPLIFIVDELDRCRPSFALETLERIKHFFSVPNVHFVLGVSTSQLENSVAVAYGPNVKPRIYLEKFLHFTFTLPSRDHHRNHHLSREYIQHLVRAYGLTEDKQNSLGSSTAVISKYADREDLSFRTVERIVANLSIALAYTPSNMYKPGAIIGGLCILKVRHPNLYQKARDRRLRFTDISNIFGFRDYDAKHPENESSETGQESNLRGWWLLCTEHDLPEAIQKRFSRAIEHVSFTYGIDDMREIIPIVCSQVMDSIVTFSDG